MPKPIDISGQKFGFLTAIRLDAPRINKNGKPRRMWFCVCDCGGSKVVHQRALANGATVSCGCFASLVMRERNSTHRMSGTFEHRVWKGMRSRCSTTNNHDTANYVERGITCCERWASFENFFADMGSAPSEKHTLERIDNDGPYASWNCRWATRKEQNNNRRNNHFITANGVKQTISAWAKATGIRTETISYRIKKLGWPPDLAATTPARQRVHL